MKKTSNYAWLAAALLAGMTGFTACSSDDAADVNPTTAGESVKTQFSISLTDKAGKTRLTEAQVQGQETPDFLGMTDIHLYSFAINNLTGDPGTLKPVASTNTALNGYVQLEQFGAFDKTISNKKVYTNVDIPIGTTAFLFYGKAIDNTETTGSYVSSDNAISWPSSENAAASSIYFEHEPYRSTGLTTSAVETLSALNAFYKIVYGVSETSDDWTKRINSFKTLRSGSSENVLAAVQLFCEKSATDEAFVKALFGVESVPTTEATKELGTGKTMKFTYTPAGTDDASIKCEWTDASFNFPYYINGTVSKLPNGSVVLSFNDKNETTTTTTKTAGEFELATTSASGMLTTDIDKFVKPVPLYYFANSPAMTDDDIHFTGTPTTDYSGEQWSTVIGTSSEYGRNAVAASTRSVIIENQIQYGVGMLDYTAKVSGAVLKDNSDEDVTVVADGAGKLQLTGILIGGQMPVDFKFEPVLTDGTPKTYQKTIYDYTLNGTTPVNLTTTATTDQYTMAFETPEPTTDASKSKSKIKVALEFVNNTGAAFEGYAGNIIPEGSTFYLLAELDPTQGKMQSGATTTINQVFKQDYKTIANFTISSLKDAYNFIPNLDATSLEFGMSVDLTWTPGLTFGVEIK